MVQIRGGRRLEPVARLGVPHPAKIRKSHPKERQVQEVASDGNDSIDLSVVRPQKLRSALPPRIPRDRNLGAVKVCPTRSVLWLGRSWQGFRRPCSSLCCMPHIPPLLRSGTSRGFQFVRRAFPMSGWHCFQRQPRSHIDCCILHAIVDEPGRLELLYNRGLQIRQPLNSHKGEAGLARLMVGNNGYQSDTQTLTSRSTNGTRIPWRFGHFVSHIPVAAQSWPSPPPIRQ